MISSCQYDEVQGNDGVVRLPYARHAGVDPASMYFRQLNYYD